MWHGRESCREGKSGPLEQTCFQPRQFGGELPLDIGNPHLDHPVVAGLQPGLPGGAIGDNRLRLGRVDQLDRDPVHEGDEVGDVAADRGLPLKLPGEAPVDTHTYARVSGAWARIWSNAEADELWRTMSRSLAESNTGDQISSLWLYRMLYSPHPLREKLTLFWHNHFATSNAKVQNAGYMLGQYEMLRRHAQDYITSLPTGPPAYPRPSPPRGFACVGAEGAEEAVPHVCVEAEVHVRLLVVFGVERAAADVAEGEARPPRRAEGLDGLRQ